MKPDKSSSNQFSKTASVNRIEAKGLPLYLFLRPLFFLIFYCLWPLFSCHHARIRSLKRPRFTQKTYTFLLLFSPFSFVRRRTTTRDNRSSFCGLCVSKPRERLTLWHERIPRPIMSHRAWDESRSNNSSKRSINFQVPGRNSLRTLYTRKV